MARRSKASAPAGSDTVSEGERLVPRTAPLPVPTAAPLAEGAGCSREESYAFVQRNAMKVWEHGADFLEELLADKDVRAALNEDEIREKFDLGYHTKHVNTIFARVFGNAL